MTKATSKKSLLFTGCPCPTNNAEQQERFCVQVDA